MASSMRSPATRTDSLTTMPYMEMTAASVRPPPISTTMLPLGDPTGMRAPMAAARGSGMRGAGRRGPEGSQLLVQVLVPPVQVVDVGDFCPPLGRQPGQDQGGARPYVQGPHAGSDERRGAADQGGGAGRGHLGPHLAHLADVEQPCIEDAFVYEADALCLCEEDCHGGLQVGGQARVGDRLRVDGPERAAATP